MDRRVLALVIGVVISFAGGLYAGSFTSSRSATDPSARVLSVTQAER